MQDLNRSDERLLGQCGYRLGNLPVATEAEQDGGAEGARTPDPHNAIVVLYQLSYDPI